MNRSHEHRRGTGRRGLDDRHHEGKFVPSGNGHVENVAAMTACDDSIGGECSSFPQDIAGHRERTTTSRLSFQG